LPLPLTWYSTLITSALLSVPLGVAPIVTGLTVAELPIGWFTVFTD